MAATVTAIVTAGVVLAGMLAGCGSGGSPARRPWRPPAVPEPSAVRLSSIRSLTAAEIIQRALRTTSLASSLRIRGTVTKQGERYAVDLRYNATGGRGRIRTHGQALDLLRIQKDVWFSGDETFWRGLGGETAVRAFHGHYLRIPFTDRRFTPIVDDTYAAKMLRALLHPGGTFTKGAMGRVHGQPAISVVDRTKGHGGTVWVAAQGPPYVLRLQAAKDSAVAGTVDFLDYDERFTLVPPDPKRVVDADDLN